MIIRICFYGNLPELLTSGGKGEWQAVEFPGKRSVKDLIQAMGIPHTEVGNIHVNERCRELHYILRENDSIEVFPPSPGDLSGVGEQPRFLCDVHLWKLARRLRLLGFDTRFNPQWDDAQLAERSQKERLILLSRDRGLLKRNNVRLGLLIRSTDSEQQVYEVLERIGRSVKTAPFSRCLLCNAILEPVCLTGSVFENRIKPQIPADILRWCRIFHFCPSCEKVYWKGSHYEKLLRMIDNYLAVPTGSAALHMTTM